MKYYRMQVVQTGSSVIKRCDHPGIGRRHQRECESRGSAAFFPEAALSSWVILPSQVKLAEYEWIKCTPQDLSLRELILHESRIAI